MTHWIQSRSVGQVLSYLTVALVAIVGLVIYFTLPAPTAQAVDPIEITDPTAFTLDEPASGSQVTLTLDDDFVQVGDPKTVEVTNVTLGETTNGTWSSGAEVTFTGGVGDLISVKVLDNETPQTSDTATLGYVPAPTDSAKPDLLTADISSSLSGSDFDVTVDAKGLQDQSWPCDLELFFDGAEEDSTSVTQHNGSENTVAITLSADGITTGDRLILRATDDYGNRTEVHLIANGGFSAAGTTHFPSLSDYRPTDTFCNAEKTGQHAEAGTGVHLFARNFVHSVTVYSLKGLALPFNVTLNYRSTMDYDGPWGQFMECSLDKRLDKPTTKYRYWMGDGTVWNGFTTTESPKGLFLEYKSGTNHRLVDAQGNELRFDGTTGLLKQIRDGYGNIILIRRNADDQVTYVQDDLGRRIHFAYYDHGRLAEISDFGGREVLFDYDTDGCLTKITRADGSFYSFAYTKQNNKYLMSTVYRATKAGGTALVALENTYETTDDRVTEQRNMYNLNGFGDPIKFTLNPTGGPTKPSATDMDVVRVEDADGHEVDYGFHDSNGLLMCIRRHHDTTLRDSAPWTTSTNPDPDWIDTWFEHNSDNLMLSARYIQHEDQTGSPKPELAREEWDYQSPDTGDVVDRGRVKKHRLAGDDGAGAGDPEESWTYNGTYASWPDTHTDFNGVVTKYVYNAKGQMTESKIESVTPVGGTAYDIVTSFEYDPDDGRLLKMTNPNRNDDSSTHESVKYTYYGSSDGHQNGYLKKVERLDDTGSAALWTEYEYDVYGNQTRDEDQAGVATEYQYDPLDRRTKRIWDQDFTHPDAPTTPQEQVETFEYEGDELVETKHTYYDLEGTGDSSNSTGGLVMSTSSWTECTSTTGAVRVTTRRYGLPADNTFDKVETEFDARGNAIARRDYYTTTAYTETTSEYDALGQLLSTALDPSTATGDDIEQWYAYDFARRETQLWRSHWDEPRRMYYDEYGRVEKKVSTLVALGRTFDVTTDSYDDYMYGYFQTVHTYSSNDFSLRERTQEYAYIDDDPLAPTDSGFFDAQNHDLVEETKYSYDEASRQTKVEEWITGTDYAVTEYTLLPSGQTTKTHKPTEGTPADYTETKYDSLDRVTDEIDETGNNKIVTQYSSTTGLVEGRNQHVYDEKDNATLIFETGYFYDNRGRVKEARRYERGGNKSTDYISDLTAYDGAGNIARTESKEGSTSGRVVEREIGVAGQTISEKRWRPSNAAVYAKDRFEYDAKGRRTQSEVLFDSSTTPETWLTTEYSYDDADRVVEIKHPPFDVTPAADRKTTFAYGYATYEGSVTVPWTKETQPTGAYGETLTNQIGSKLQTTVTNTAAVSVDGPTKVEFAYGDSAACGCGAYDKATQARTFHDDPTSPEVGDSVVRRTYTSSRLSEEEIHVWDGNSWESVELTFDSDKRGRPTQVVIPDVGTYNGATLDREFREDGVLAALDRTPEGGSLSRVMEYEYVGNKPRWQLSKDAQAAPNQDTVSEGGFTYDEYFRQDSVEWQNRPIGGGNDYEDEYTSFTPDGLPLERDRAGGTYTDSYTYEGDNWLSQKTIDSGTGGSSSPDIVYTRKNTGQLSRRELDGTTYTLDDWDYTYGTTFGDAGLLTDISDEHEISADGETVVSEAGGTRYIYIDRIVSDREFSYDDSGREYEREYNLEVRLGCHSTITSDPSGWKEYDVDIIETQTYDFWGRQVYWIRDEGTNSTQTPFWCDGGPNTGTPVDPYDLPELERFTYFDAFGRVAYTRVEGEYFAYLDDEAKIEDGNGDPTDVHVDVDSDTDSPDQVYYYYDRVGPALLVEYDGTGVSPTLRVAKHFYNNPTTGRPDKGQNSLFTINYGLRGEIVASNAGCLATSPAGAEGDLDWVFWDNDGTVLEEGESSACVLYLSDFFLSHRPPPPPPECNGCETVPPRIVHFGLDHAAGKVGLRIENSVNEDGVCIGYSRGVCLGLLPCRFTLTVKARARFVFRDDPPLGFELGFSGQRGSKLPEEFGTVPTDGKVRELTLPAIVVGCGETLTLSFGSIEISLGCTDCEEPEPVPTGEL